MPERFKKSAISQKTAYGAEEEKNTIAGFLLEENLQKGKNLEIPSLGIVIQKKAELAKKE